MPKMECVAVGKRSGSGAGMAAAGTSRPPEASESCPRALPALEGEGKAAQAKAERRMRPVRWLCLLRQLTLRELELSVLCILKV